MKTTLTITNRSTRKSITFKKIDVDIVDSPDYGHVVSMSKTAVRKIASTFKILNIDWSKTTWSTPTCSKIDRLESGDCMSGYIVFDKPDLNPKSISADPRFKSLTFDYDLV